MDWNNDGDDDYFEGFVDGIFVWGPWQVSLAIAVIGGIYWFYCYCNNQG